MVNKIPYNSIISPHAICDSCGKNSGPTFTLPELRDCTDFLRENVIPTGIEREMTLQDIGKAEEMISRIGVEVNQLKQVLTSLKQQREVLREFRNREKSLLAPIRKLPDDVLRHLFVTCQRYPTDDGPIRVFYRNDTTLTAVMNVCTHWCHVARSFPELWSRIQIWNDYSGGPDLWSKRSVAGAEKFLDACISFSGEIPFCMQIELKPVEDSCVRRIARCAYRWKEIVVFHSGDLFGDIMKYVDPDLVLTYLEKLFVDEVKSSITINPSPVLFFYFLAEDLNRSSELQDVTVSFKSAPHLWKLIIRFVHRPMATFVDLPWGQITTFESTFNEYDVNKLALLLKSMPNLVSFTLGNGDPNITETIMLPSLKIFRLENRSGRYISDVLDALIAPHLEILHLYSSDMSPSSVFQFLTRSCCPLVDLKLTDIYLNGECVETCPSLRTVKKLSLVIPNPDWTNVLSLRRKDRHSGLWLHVAFPQLQSLELIWIDLKRRGEFSDLIHVLKLRISPTPQFAGLEGDITKLQEVKIIFTKYLTQEEKDAFYELNRSDLVRQSGVVLNISHKFYGNFIIQNGISVNEETTDSKESSSSGEDNTDSDDSINSSYDTNADSEETSGSSEASESD